MSLYFSPWFFSVVVLVHGCSGFRLVSALSSDWHPFLTDSCASLHLSDTDLFFCFSFRTHFNDYMLEFVSAYHHLLGQLLLTHSIFSLDAHFQPSWLGFRDYHPIYFSLYSLIAFLSLSLLPPSLLPSLSLSDPYHHASLSFSLTLSLLLPRIPFSFMCFLFHCPLADLYDCLKMYQMKSLSHKVHHSINGKLENANDRRRKMFSSGENPRRHYSGKFAVIITICQSNYAT